MINFKKGELNKVIVTLTERVTISNPFFLFSVTSKATKEEVKTFVTDVSSYPARYNEFSVDLDLEKGDYIYNFYQKDTDANTETDGARNLETGLLRVDGTQTTTKYYTPQ